MRRLWRAKRWHDPQCAWRKRYRGIEVPETKKHMNWECPQWEEIRGKYKRALARRGITREEGSLPEGKGVTEAFMLWPRQ